MSSPRIMVVEDERITAEAVKCTLEDLGYVVCAIVGTGPEAILAAGTERPDLVLMDIILAGPMDGIDAAEQIRSAYGIPIVYATAYADEPFLRRAKVTAPYGYILKPFTVRELHSNVEMALHKSQLDRRIARLNAVLDTIRRVNQLAIRERARDRLLQRVCELLVEHGGYVFAWAVLINEAGELFLTAQAGLDEEQFQLAVESLRRGDRPSCFQRAAAEPSGVLISLRPVDCPDCPLRHQYPSAQALTVRVGHGSPNPGLLFVGIPTTTTIDETERTLIGELADDVSVALHAIQAEGQRKRAEEALATSEERYRRITESISDYVYTVHVENGTPVRTTHSPTSVTVTGYTSEEYTADPALWLQMIHPDDRSQVFEQTRRILTGERPEPIEHRITTKDGTERWVRSTLVAHTNTAGEVDSYEGVVEDISDRKQAEAERARLEERLQQIDKLNACGELALGVAHEVNNCLTAISASVGLLQRRLASSAPVEEPLAVIHRAVSQAASIARSLQTFGRDLPVQKEPVDLRDLLNETRLLLVHTLPKVIALEIAWDREGPVWVRADRVQLQQVLLNLALNARDAMPDGGVLRIAVSSVPTPGDTGSGEAPVPSRNAVQLSVTDTGSGIPPEVRSRIFDPFFTTKPRGKGTGLGLSIVHGIVEDHGGEIDVQSAVGVGTTFTISLPCLEAGAEASPEARSPAGPRGQGEVVLVAMRDSFLCGIITSFLQSVGYRALPAGSSDAVAAGFRLHAADVRLAVVDGEPAYRGECDLLREIRREHSETPILVVAGAGASQLDPFDEHTVLLSGAFDMPELARMVHETLTPIDCEEAQS